MQFGQLRLYLYIIVKLVFYTFFPFHMCGNNSKYLSSLLLKILLLFSVFKIFHSVFIWQFLTLWVSLIFIFLLNKCFLKRTCAYSVGWPWCETAAWVAETAWSCFFKCVRQKMSCHQTLISQMLFLFAGFYPSFLVSLCTPFSACALFPKVSGLLRDHSNEFRYSLLFK